MGDEIWRGVRKEKRKAKGKAEEIAKAIKRSPAGKKAAEALKAKRGIARRKEQANYQETLASGPPFAVIILAQIMFGVILSLFSGPGPAAIAEIFPTRRRSTLMTTGYALAPAIFGGFAPFVATWLIAVTGDPLSPSFYLMATALLSVIALMAVQYRAARVPAVGQIGVPAR